MRIVKKPEERRAEMVTAAAKLFMQKGFVKTSVAEIVAAVDVAKGLFYYYFTTKDDMVKAVVEGFAGQLGGQAQRIADGEGSAQEKITRLMELDTWNRCFTEVLLADLCMAQHAALYSDMCDRLVDHLRPSVVKITQQAFAEHGLKSEHAERLVGLCMYGVMMMARRGEMTMRGVREVFAEITGLANADANA